MKALDACVEAAVALLMVGLTLVVFLGVVFRYFFLAPLAWTEEIGRLCLVWMSFLGAYLALHRGQHMYMELSRRRLSRRAQRWLEGVGHGILAAFCGVLIYQGAAYAERFMSAPSPYLGIPTGVKYAALPVGAGLFLLAVARLLAGGSEVSEGHPVEGS